MHDVRAWLTLQAISGIGPARFRALLSRFGSPEAVLQAKVKDLITVPGIDEKLAGAIGLCQLHDYIETQLEQMAKYHVQVITSLDPAYPELLKGIYDAPPLLFTRGGITVQDKNSIAIVGCRAPSDYGKLMAGKLSTELTRKGITIVSGMARGIDTVGHRSCLAAGGRTLAVIGCGVDVVYPPENKRLMEEIVERGAVISEFPMGTPPEAPHFPRRNRIISGLSLGSVIVEAGEKSGALLTAEFALNQNRGVFAVPGQVTSLRSKGTNTLIQQGAKLVMNAEDIWEELAPSLDTPSACGPSILPEIRLSSEEQLLYDVLSATPISIDAIVNQTQLPPPRALVLLLSMELNGLVRQLAGKMFVRT